MVIIAFASDTRLGDQFQPTLVQDDTVIPFLRSLTSERDGWYERGPILSLDLPPS